MTVSEQLRAAKALIDTPEKWTKEEIARGKSGKAVSFLSKASVCFCATGALFKANLFYWPEKMEQFLPAFDTSKSDDSLYLLAQYNDHPDTTHADIMALFDRAIADAEGRGE